MVTHFHPRTQKVQPHLLTQGLTLGVKGLTDPSLTKGLVKKYRVGSGGGGGGGWAGAFGNVVVKKTHGAPLPFGTKLSDPPLNEG